MKDYEPKILYRGFRIDNTKDKHIISIKSETEIYKYSGEWVYWEFGSNETYDINCNFWNDDKIVGETISRYSGLRDAIGYKLFIGDIVNTLINFGPAGDQMRLELVSDSPYRILQQMWVFETEHKLPVKIGNKWENPDLLEEL